MIIENRITERTTTESSQAIITVRHGDSERAAEVKRYLKPFKIELKRALNVNFRKIRGLAHPISKRKVKKTFQLQRQTIKIFLSAKYRSPRDKADILSELQTILANVESVIADVPYNKKQAIWAVKADIVDRVKSFIKTVARVQSAERITDDTPLMFP